MNAEHSKAIVIVDDEKSYLDLMSQLLTENLSVPVHAFTRPLAALAALPNIEVGLIVTDYSMPQINGLEFIVRARGVKPDAPFLVLTGHGVHLSEDEFTHLPELKSVLHKPLGWRELAKEIIRYWPDDDPPVIGLRSKSEQA